MPIEIRELVIKAVVGRESEKNVPEYKDPGESGFPQDDLLEETVKQILEQLNENRNER